MFAVHLLAADGAGPVSLFQPWLVFVLVGAVMAGNAVRAARKRRARPAPPAARPAPPLRPGQGTARPAAPGPAVPFAGTLLNGVPMAPYATPYGVLPPPVPNERVRAEAELKRQLDALDAARRGGQVTAEQYAAHRDAIFKNF